MCRGAVRFYPKGPSSCRIVVRLCFICNPFYSSVRCSLSLSLSFSLPLMVTLILIAADNLLRSSSDPDPRGFSKYPFPSGFCLQSHSGSVPWKLAHLELGLAHVMGWANTVMGSLSGLLSFNASSPEPIFHGLPLKAPFSCHRLWNPSPRASSSVAWRTSPLLPRSTKLGYHKGRSPSEVLTPAQLITAPKVSGGEGKGLNGPQFIEPGYHLGPFGLLYCWSSGVYLAFFFSLVLRSAH